MKANIAAGSVVLSQQPPVEPANEGVQLRPSPVEIRLDEAIREDMDTVTTPPVKDKTQCALAPSPSRKRSCEVAEIADEAVEGIDTVATDERNIRSKTPPEKRQKLGEETNRDVVAN